MQHLGILRRNYVKISNHGVTTSFDVRPQALAQKSMYAIVHRSIGCPSILTRNHGSKKDGGEGYRSPYLPHAKRTLYHVSYTPKDRHLRDLNPRVQSTMA